MKTWNETREVLEDANACLRAGQACAIVVLTQVKGSAFRRPGAKLLIRADGTMSGNVSGGCLENDLRERALACMNSGESATVHYNTGSDEDVIWGLGLGCDGELDLLIVPVAKKAAWIDELLEAMKSFSSISIAWPRMGDTAGQDALPCLMTGRAKPPAEPNVFIDELLPPPTLLIIGAGDDAIPLAQQAALSGFRVTVMDHRSGYLTEERFPGIPFRQLRPEAAAEQLSVDAHTMVVIKNHALEMDKKWAAFFDQTDARYIGILGPKKRCGEVREHMTKGDMARVYGPAGLDLGAEGAEQIAASIIAEMLAVWSGRHPVHLREREAPIHDR